MPPDVGAGGGYVAGVFVGEGFALWAGYEGWGEGGGEGVGEGEWEESEEDGWEEHCWLSLFG